MRYKQFKPSELKPTGWLRHQLEIQAAGLAGQLDKVWPDVRDSAWIGGNCEGWERVPYWLDGALPLALLLEDKDLKLRTERYVNAIIERMRPDGWICPCEDERRSEYDIWAAFLIGKVLAEYYEATGDERLYITLRRSMKCLHTVLSEGTVRLFSWGQFRWFEALIPLRVLKTRQDEPWIGELANILRDQGANYTRFEELWKTPLNKWTYETHIVNLAMALKTQALASEFFDSDDNNAEHMWKLLEKYNGTAVGTFTGDECLSGIGANHGTELCSVVELMYSCELLYMATGRNVWADRLEKAAYNALPATISDDMWTHQYDQMVNQIECTRFPGKSFFRTNSSDAHIFGLEPCYGCCTANFGQGWPKLAKNVFLRSADGGVMASLMLPSILETEIKNVPVTITSQTEYPFRKTCRYTICTKEPVKFNFRIRIPSFVESYTVNGERRTERVVAINRVWNGTYQVEIELDYSPKFKARPFSLYTVEYGPLVFALPVETEYVRREFTDNGVERKFPYCDYELLRRSEWEFAFCDSKLEVFENDGDDIPFSSHSPKLGIDVKVCPIDWGYEDGYENVAASRPKSRRPSGEARTVRLIPYGCAKLRMTELPFLKNH